MGCALDVVAVIVDSANIALISQSLADQGKRGNAVKRCCLNSDGGISQHAIEKVADSKAFTISTASLT